MMRTTTVAITIVLAALSTQALAATKKQKQTHLQTEAKLATQITSRTTGLNWNACYELGYVRGVHIENGDLPDWMDECLAGKVPFSNAEPGVVRSKYHYD